MIKIKPSWLSLHSISNRYRWGPQSSGHGFNTRWGKRSETFASSTQRCQILGAFVHSAIASSLRAILRSAGSDVHRPYRPVARAFRRVQAEHCHRPDRQRSRAADRWQCSPGRVQQPGVFGGPGGRGPANGNSTKPSRTASTTAPGLERIFRPIP
jgi:hypothetical protein